MTKPMKKRHYWQVHKVDYFSLFNKKKNKKRMINKINLKISKQILKKALIKIKKQIY